MRSPHVGCLTRTFTQGSYGTTLTVDTVLSVLLCPCRQLYVVCWTLTAQRCLCSLYLLIWHSTLFFCSTMITPYYTRCHLDGSKISLFAFRGHRILEFTGGRFHIDSWIMTEAPVCIFISIEIWAPAFWNCVTTNRELDGGPPSLVSSFPTLECYCPQTSHIYQDLSRVSGSTAPFWARFSGTVNYRSIL